MIKYIAKTCCCSFEKINMFLMPIFNIIIRIKLANDFFKSGWIKFSNFLNGNWYLTEFLFKEEHPVPYIPASLAAILGTGAELVFPVMILLGLMGRLGALGLLAMAILIETTYLHSSENIMWMFMSSYLFIYGFGKYSLDYIIFNKIKKTYCK